jgi:hypothetical protein
MQCNSINERKFAVPMPLRKGPSKNTCNAMLAPPENAAEVVRRKYAPSLFERRKMLEMLESDRYARSLEMLESGNVLRHAVYDK